MPYKKGDRGVAILTPHSESDRVVMLEFLEGKPELEYKIRPGDYGPMVYVYGENQREVDDAVATLHTLAAFDQNQRFAYESRPGEKYKRRNDMNIAGTSIRTESVTDISLEPRRKRGSTQIVKERVDTVVPVFDLHIRASSGSYSGGMRMEVGQYDAILGGTEMSIYDDNNNMLVSFIADIENMKGSMMNIAGTGIKVEDVRSVKESQRGVEMTTRLKEGFFRELGQFIDELREGGNDDWEIGLEVSDAIMDVAKRRNVDLKEFADGMSQTASTFK